MKWQYRSVTEAENYFKDSEMKVSLEIETSQEDFVQCICAAWALRYPDDQITPEQVKVFNVGDVVTLEDTENMLMGSSLGELCQQSKNVKMKRVE